MTARIALAVLSVMVVAACGGAPQPATQPPGATPTIGLPTQPGGPTPTSGGTTATPGNVTANCELVTTEELSTILGVQMNAVESSGGECTWFAATGFPGISIRFEEGSLADSRALLTNPQDISVAGHQAVIGSLLGVIVYVARGNTQLVVQSVFTDDTPATRQQVVRIAETAVGRWR